jgi:hypothetical protein
LRSLREKYNFSQSRKGKHHAKHAEKKLKSLCEKIQFIAEFQK